MEGIYDLFGLLVISLSISFKSFITYPAAAIKTVAVISRKKLNDVNATGRFNAFRKP